MKDDIISLSDETYYRGASVILGEPSYVKVIVESSFDVPFWHDFLTGVLPDKTFDISPFSNEPTDLTMGKAHIYQKSEEGGLGPHYLGCVDADYDYLLGNRTHEGQVLNASKYIIHTYAYSVENLLCCPEGFNQICTQAIKCQVTCPFTEWMKEISIAIYPLLVWSLYLDSRDDDHQVFSVTDWAHVFPHDKSYCDEDAHKELLTFITSAVERWVCDIESKVSDEDRVAKDDLESYLVSSKGLKPEDSNMYVRGHDMFRFILDTMLKPVCKKAKEQHLMMIDARAKDEKERKNNRQQYVNQTKDVDTYLEANYAYKSFARTLYNGMRQRCLETQKTVDNQRSISDSL